MVGIRYLLKSTNLYLLFEKKEILPEQWKESIIVCIYKKGETISCSNYVGISLLFTSYKILFNIILGRLPLKWMKLLGTINMVLDVTDRLLSKYFIFARYRRKNGSIRAQYINYVGYRLKKKACDSVKNEVLYNILTEFGIPKKLG